MILARRPHIWFTPKLTSVQICSWASWNLTPVSLSLEIYIGFIVKEKAVLQGYNRKPWPTGISQTILIRSRGRHTSSREERMSFEYSIVLWGFPRLWLISFHSSVPSLERNFCSKMYRGKKNWFSSRTHVMKASSSVCPSPGDAPLSKWARFTWRFLEQSPTLFWALSRLS